DADLQLPSAPHGGRLPTRDGCLLINRPALGVLPPRLGLHTPAQPVDAVGAETLEVVVLVGRLEIPVAGEGVEVSAAGLPGRHPEVDVLAVAVDGRAAREQPAGV